MEMVAQLKLKGKAFAECFTLDQDLRMPSEMKDDACLIYVQEGSQEIFGSLNKVEAKDRESLLVKCGHYITNFSNISPSNPVKSIVFHLDPAIIREAFGNKELDFLSPEGDVLENPALKVNQSELMDTFVASLRPYFKKPQLATNELMSVKLQELVLIVSDSGRNELANQLISRLYTPDKIHFDKVIEANMYNNLTIAEFAFLTHRSESTFKRDFNKWYGVSPAKYFKQEKLQKAASLLQHSKLPISEIGWECGFENAAHFSSSFSKKYGKSPKEFRTDPN